MLNVFVLFVGRVKCKICVVILCFLVLCSVRCSL